jgi:hypothetical protein
MFGELLDHLPVESGNISRHAADDKPFVCNDLLIDPIGPGVDQVCLSAAPSETSQ